MNAQPACSSFSLRCAGVPAGATYGLAAALLVISLKAPRPLAALALGGIVLVAAPDWHGHYGLLLLPPIVVAASGFWKELRSRRIRRQTQLAADTSRRRTARAPAS
jgi:hypothetical protein